MDYTYHLKKEIGPVVWPHSSADTQTDIQTDILSLNKLKIMYDYFADITNLLDSFPAHKAAMAELMYIMKPSQLS